MVAIGHCPGRQALAVRADELRLEDIVEGCLQQRGDVRVFLGDEAFDFVFASADEPERHRLHAACGTRARQLAPQDRREIEADEVIERAAGEIGVDQVGVDLARIGHRIEHRLLGDGIEDHALDGLVADRLLAPEKVEHMPGDGLALAIGVGREEERVGFLDRVGNVVDALGRGRIHFPGHGEVIVRLHRPILGRQVADMAEGGQHLVARAEIFVDCLRLCGRFDDDDVHYFLPAGTISGRSLRMRALFQSRSPHGKPFRSGGSAYSVAIISIAIMQHRLRLRS